MEVYRGFQVGSDVVFRIAGNRKLDVFNELTGVGPALYGNGEIQINLYQRVASLLAVPCVRDLAKDRDT